MIYYAHHHCLYICTCGFCFFFVAWFVFWPILPHFNSQKFSIQLKKRHTMNYLGTFKKTFCMAWHFTFIIFFFSFFFTFLSYLYFFFFGNRNSIYTIIAPFFQINIYNCTTLHQMQISYISQSYYLLNLSLYIYYVVWLSNLTFGVFYLIKYTQMRKKNWINVCAHIKQKKKTTKEKNVFFL